MLLKLSKDSAGLHVGGREIRHESFGPCSVRNATHGHRYKRTVILLRAISKASSSCHSHSTLSGGDTSRRRLSWGEQFDVPMNGCLGEELSGTTRNQAIQWKTYRLRYIAWFHSFPNVPRPFIVVHSQRQAMRSLRG